MWRPASRVGGDDGDPGAVGQGRRQVAGGAVDVDGHGGLGQARPDGGGQVGAGGSGRQLPGGVVGQVDGDLSGPMPLPARDYGRATRRPLGRLSAAAAGGGLRRGSAAGRASGACALAGLSRLPLTCCTAPSGWASFCSILWAVRRPVSGATLQQGTPSRRSGCGPPCGSAPSPPPAPTQATPSKAAAARHPLAGGRGGVDGRERGRRVQVVVEGGRGPRPGRRHPGPAARQRASRAAASGISPSCQSQSVR